jgi:hypothetical protein
MTGVTSTTISSMSMSIPPLDVTPVMLKYVLLGLKLTNLLNTVFTNFHKFGSN